MHKGHRQISEFEQRTKQIHSYKIIKDISKISDEAKKYSEHDKNQNPLEPNTL